MSLCLVGLHLINAVFTVKDVRIIVRFRLFATGVFDLYPEGFLEGAWRGSFFGLLYVEWATRVSADLQQTRVVLPFVLLGSWNEYFS